MKAISTSVIALALTAALGTSAIAAAQDYGSRYDSGNSRYDYRYDTYNARDVRNTNARRDIATVIRVDERWGDPGYERQECWNERSNGYESGYYRDQNGRLYRGDSTANGTLLGAIIGGALGNQVGKGDGRKAATVAGAVAGGVIGNNIDRNHDSGQYQYQDNSGVTRRCRTVSDGGRFGGYDVTYRYAGQTYHALMNQRPGRTLRVMVEVRPQFEGMARNY
jgi:uncharacterized protein YcfJ